VNKNGFPTTFSSTDLTATKQVVNHMKDRRIGLDLGLAERRFW
jgi:hypothetical protein